ncbi:hypothetical protein AAVH_31193, partial [Aphelenchoides avenae]
IRNSFVTMIASACFIIVCGSMNLVVMAYFLRRKLHNVATSKKNRVHLHLFLIAAVSLLCQSVQAVYQ